MPCLCRDAKVATTASLRFCRFYLSKPIMIFDPKMAIVSLTFLVCKVQDCRAGMRCMEEGTNTISALVIAVDILRVEVNVLEGVNFDLLCFHTYKVRQMLMRRRGNQTTVTGDDPPGEQ